MQKRPKPWIWGFLCLLALTHCNPERASRNHEQNATRSSPPPIAQTDFAASSAFHCPKFTEARAIGAVQGPRLSEISGVVASREHPGILWVHNDSGDDANLYSIDHSGTFLKSFKLKTRSRDWEDIALLSRPGRADYLYIADIGDNLAHRKSGVLIHRFKEPKKPRPKSKKKKARSSIIKKHDTLRLLYPDSPQDSEALIVDPWSAQIILITKPRLGPPQVYTFDGFSKKGTLKLEATLSSQTAGAPLYLITGADISPDGHWILLRSYLGIFLFYREKGQSVAEALSGKACTQSPPNEMQGEAIAFLQKPEIDTSSSAPPPFLTISEGLNANLFQFLALESQ